MVDAILIWGRMRVDVGDPTSYEVETHHFVDVAMSRQSARTMGCEFSLPL